MVILPTLQKTAKEILSIFVHQFNCRPGNTLLMNNILLVMRERGLSDADFKPAMEYAAHQGWVEVLEGGTSFRLTEAGFLRA
jgi:hypothetical protein